MSGWRNEEHVATLKELHADGKSAAEICEALNHKFRDASYSREAVCGKLWRIGLGREPPSRPQRAPAVARIPHAGSGLNMKGAKSGGAPAVVFAGPGVPPPPAPKAPSFGRKHAFTPLPGSRPMPWTERARNGCTWPVGEKDGVVLSCCLPAAERGWCEAHLDLGLARTVKTPTANELMRGLRRHVA